MPKIIDQISKFGKSFGELTIDTVKGFLTDSKKSKFKIFLLQKRIKSIIIILKKSI